ncbi:3-methyl-2-oxobutanoate hydroxymethyltransferase [Ammonifex degensii KC4]|uniref:3-methyl-2-oxobutanoate hydroxymethyltransferase n=1 Tax=Ammonifex degensii (strain DSM 10501 / KC4) TaxID=429009 RepID=C9R9H9_AMMDK|nr:3-methyl-2-oxobutanoate hydroxymethyltransferase [Ammonifex degensii]ACX52958.1 3-methyl-2-oxobutanoate hydroxymethyltransferase [Ammonifex degensii KC4]
MNKVTTADFRRWKMEKRPITMLTAYDYSLARLVDEAGIDAILVGDSVGNVVLGYPNTLPVTMEEMLHHTRAVVRGVKRALVIGDMPFLSYQVSKEEAIRNAGRFLKEAGAEAVKLEGGEEIAPTVEALVKSGIPVMGHIGLTPQYVHQLGGYRVQGKEAAAARKLIRDAQALAEAGVFALVLECVPQEVAQEITASLPVPTIGIGAGPHCDGQVLVTHDLLGLYGGFTPKFVKRYANLVEEIKKALAAFREEVQNRVFPGPEHSFSMAPEEYRAFKEGKE